MVAYDGTIRNSNRYVVQLLYGEDGMSGEHIEFQDIASIAPSHEAFNRAFYFDITNERYKIPFIVSVIVPFYFFLHYHFPLSDWS